MPRGVGLPGVGRDSLTGSTGGDVTVGAGTSEDNVVSISREGWLNAAYVAVSRNPISNSTSSECYCEIWLIRGGDNLLLDRGGVMDGSVCTAKQVGGSGALWCPPGSIILVRTNNYSAVDVNLKISAWVDVGLDTLENPAVPGSWVPMSNMDGGKGAFIYQARRVATQANVGGGAVIIDISLATGQVGKLIGCMAVNSGTNTLRIRMIDEDNTSTLSLAYVANAAGNVLHLPSIGTAASATDNYANSIGLIIPAGAKISVSQANAGVQNDTCTCALILLLNNPTTPSWSVARSTNAGDVTLADSTIANAMQYVVLP